MSLVLSLTNVTMFEIFTFQAMSDFRHMFPNMDEEVIEAVLRANNGAVDETIDQLLTMNVDCNDQTSHSSSTVNNHVDRSYVNQHDPPPQVQNTPSTGKICVTTVQ